MFVNLCFLDEIYFSLNYHKNGNMNNKRIKNKNKTQTEGLVKEVLFSMAIIRDDFLCLSVELISNSFLSDSR